MLTQSERTSLYNEAFRLLREARMLLLRANRKHIMFNLKHKGVLNDQSTKPIGQCQSSGIN